MIGCPVVCISTAIFLSPISWFVSNWCVVSSACILARRAKIWAFTPTLDATSTKFVIIYQLRRKDKDLSFHFVFPRGALFKVSAPH